MNYLKIWIMKVIIIRHRQYHVLENEINDFLDDMNERGHHLIKMHYSSTSWSTFDGEKSYDGNIDYSAMITYATQKEVRDGKLNYLLELLRKLQSPEYDKLTDNYLKEIRHNMIEGNDLHEFVPQILKYVMNGFFVVLIEKQQAFEIFNEWKKKKNENK